MMKKITACFAIFLLQGISFAQDSISVLIIGNSYVYSNDLPGTLQQLTTSLGKEITIDSKTNGGYTFQNHLNDPVTHTKIKSKSWDVVVIQGQSQEPCFPESQVTTQTIPYALQLVDSIYANNFCGNAMYFMTWGRKTGDSQWDSINTFEKMNSRLYNTYMRMANLSEKAMVSPVGSVWAYVRANHPTIELYVSDGSHPSLAGTYLTACTFYTSLFQSSPVGASYLGGLDAPTAAILQQASAHVLDSLDKFHLHAVNKPTQADFSFTVQNGTVDFTNESVRATSYQWNFGDGNNVTTEHPIHTFNATNTYQVSLIASSVCNTDTVTIPVTIQTLSLNDYQLEDISMMTTETSILFTGDKLLEMEVITLDGKVRLRKQEFGVFGVSIPRINQVQLVNFYQNNQLIRTVRVY